MLKALRRGAFKAVPVWLVIVMMLALAIGFAAIQWISNKVTTTVTVSPIMITLSGTDTASGIINDTIVQVFNYTVEGGHPFGYVMTNITGPFTLPSDLNSIGLQVQPFGINGVMGMYTPYKFVAGNPGVMSDIWTNHTSGSDQPFDFGTTNGTITFRTNYKYNATYVVDVQITATMS